MDLPSIDDMMAMHGFSSGRLGRRTRSLGRGGRRVGVSLVALGGGMVLAQVDLCATCIRATCCRGQ